MRKIPGDLKIGDFESEVFIMTREVSKKLFEITEEKLRQIKMLKRKGIPLGVENQKMVTRREARTMKCETRKINS